jgi:hypothetical protein
VAALRTGESEGGLLAWSASCLVIGTLALMLAASLNPDPTGANAAAVLQVAMMPGERWLAMAAAMLIGSVGLLAGLPTLLVPFADRARGLAVVAVTALTAGVLGSSGYAALLIFVRALAVEEALRPGRLPRVLDDPGVALVLYAWVGSFYLGVLLIAIALLRAKSAAAWVPIVLLVVVGWLPFVSMVGHVGQVLQVLLLAVAFTEVAISAVRGARPA